MIGCLETRFGANSIDGAPKWNAFQEAVIRFVYMIEEGIRKELCCWKYQKHRTGDRVLKLCVEVIASRKLQTSALSRSKSQT
ncbi:hypothetical protein DC20_10965 [Rufibacter tibetensis]|uniref:Uncharacterized protein n=1 Tax=Rufibacter tibetensis TaxID=512763 RepID=A0A0P0CY55_9BACT|nr:hypothetical protein DC20_10965 [Rufibacter tibetensis]